MKKTCIVAAALFLTMTVISCKKEKKFAEPEYIFAKWARAIETLNYNDYASCEAYPKSEGVFREMFRDTYYTDLMVTDVEKLNEKNVLKDHQGKPYLKRNVQFECSEIRRRDRKPLRLLRGDVDFINYVGNDRPKKGWLMWNRKIIRIER
ncbi:MAG TPA: hypothetical protein PLM53_02475 [Spirochaetota bacterium]|nr:hypothetical protein [Spirochaetota bacterium]HPC41742.1 hypothetical protein [Spirochaetota bacterium]HPL19037.1 hypothetical protein [Spirochaetota bacterium]HQF06659.1 hypothetical protein [Spirochaetota bacterium]HQH95938.1 hypothetical protein [Spirochaetota bacterium]